MWEEIDKILYSFFANLQLATIESKMRKTTKDKLTRQ